LKGTAPQEERERLPEAWQVRELRPLRVPGLDADRHLVFVERKTSAASETM
jgi:16S rRNA (guanine527-N7)-methyltransferase